MKTRMYQGLLFLFVCCALTAEAMGWYLPFDTPDGRSALSTARPDLHLRVPAEASYSGDNVYSVDGINQKKMLDVPANASATYLFRVQNDGNASDTFTVTGSPAASGWSVYYKRTDTGADITAAVTGAGWSTGALASGASIGLYVQVVPWFTLPAGAGKVISVTATSVSDATKKDVVKTITTVSTRLQPDLWIRKVPNVNFGGNNIYNLTGADQAREATVAVNTTVTYAFAVQNDGNTADTLTVTGPAGGNGWTVQYYTNAGANITASVTGSGWSTGVRAAGTYVGVYVKVTPTTATPGSEKTLLLTATSTKQATKQDVVKTETTILATPSITGFTPSSGPVGTVVTVTGTELSTIITVKFNGTAATIITDVTPSSFKATVPTGATTGKISVTTLGGIADSVMDFHVMNAPFQRDMVWVPAGSFLRGSPDGLGNFQEHPQRSIYIDGYWIDKYEVTVAQYHAFCVATGHAMPPWPENNWSWAGKTGWDDPALQQHPIVNVTWTDAHAYANWAELVLPTEAQWEKAARGTSGWNYPWGGLATTSDPYNGWAVRNCANHFNSSSIGISTWPGGSFPLGVSPYGAMDMVGNVWEWCADWYDANYYAGSPASNPPGPATGNTRLIRGASWATGDAVWLRAAARYSDVPTRRDNAIGFRCVSNSPGQ